MEKMNKVKCAVKKLNKEEEVVDVKKNPTSSCYSNGGDANAKCCALLC